MASGANTRSSEQTGINIMIAGVGWQVASLGIFALLCAEFGWRIRRASESQRNPDFRMMRKTFRFKAFLWALGLALLAIFVRSVFRCAELQGGFHGKLAQQQITFMVLEGAMISSAVLLLTIFHPGLSFRGRWHAAVWSLKKSGIKAPEQSHLLVQRQAAGGSKWPAWMPGKRHSEETNDKVVEIVQASY